MKKIRWYGREFFRAEPLESFLLLSFTASRLAMPCAARVLGRLWPSALLWVPVAEEAYGRRHAAVNAVFRA